MTTFQPFAKAIKDLRHGLGAGLIRLGLKSMPPSAADWYARNGFRNLYALYSAGGPSWSGETVTVDKALNHSVAWGCVRLISGLSAMLPLQLMRETSRGKFPANGIDIPLHPAYTALHDAPNDEMTAMGFRETETAHCLTTGNLYAQIMRRSGTRVANEFYLLLPAQVHPDRDAQKRLVYVVNESTSGWNSKTYTIERGKPHDILHVRGLGNDGIRGYSVIEMARQSLGTAISQDKYGGRYFATGARQPGYIQIEPGSRFKTDTDRDNYRDELNKFFNSDRFHEMPMFEPGTKFVPYSWSPKDSQFLEARQYSIPEICRWFQVSPHLVGDLSHATFSNIENLALQFVTFTLAEWMKRWEQDLWRCVLTPTEKGQGYYFKHNISALLRGDFASRMAGYATALQNGHKSIDEVRDLEDMNPLPDGGGKAHHIQLNMQTVPGTGQPTAAEAAALSKTVGLKDLISSGDGFEVQRIQNEIMRLDGELQALKQAVNQQ